jgi:hypothetical protein
MKTIYFTNVRDQQSSDSYQVLLDHFQERNGHLPDQVRREKLYQAIFQISLLSYEGDAFGMFETSLEEGRPLTLDDGQGSIAIRVDYDPNNREAHEDTEIAHRKANDPCHIFDQVVIALNHPNSHPHFPEKGLIDHIRVSIRVEDTIVEHTFWATQYDLLKGTSEADSIFGINTVWEA